MNVNMVTCGGQATIPMVAAVSRVQPVAYAEIVATVPPARPAPARARTSTSSPAPPPARSSGGRRQEGQGDHHHQPGRAAADHARHRALPDRRRADQAAITRSVHAMIAEVQKYVPGYPWSTARCSTATASPIFMEVEGLGDFLPKYAGNLDIMTAAAARTAEMFAEEIGRRPPFATPPVTAEETRART
jgi:acetaldehyde/propanal dehydrogenase